MLRCGNAAVCPRGDSRGRFRYGLCGHLTQAQAFERPEGGSYMTMTMTGSRRAARGLALAWALLGAASAVAQEAPQDVLGARLDALLGASRRAARAWRATPVSERVAVVERACEALLRRREEIGREVTLQIQQIRAHHRRGVQHFPAFHFVVSIKNRSTSSRVGMASCAPGFVVANAPAAFA